MALNSIFFFTISIILIFLLEKVFIKFKILDYPSKRKLHSQPTPLNGGFYILISWFLSFVFFKYFFQELTLNILFFGFIIFLLGFIDDIKPMTANFKLFLSSIIILTFIYFNNFFIEQIHLNFYGIITLNFISGVLFTGLCFLLLQNSLNMMDGINGLAGSISLIWINLFLFKLEYNFLNILYLNIPILIFLYKNFQNKSFLGDGGVFFLAFIVSIMAILAHSKQKITADEIFLIFMIPGIDMLRLFVIRLINKKHPFKPDNNHLHHLLSLKFSRGYSYLIIISFILIPSLLTIFNKGITYFLIISNLLIYYFLLRNLEIKK